MPASASRPPPHPTRDSVERLYVLWIVTTVLLLFVLIVIAFFVRGALQRQATTIDALAERLANLEARAADAPRPAAPPAARPATQPATTRPAAVPPPDRTASRAAVPAGLSAEQIEAEAAALLAPDPQTTLAVLDRRAAGALLARVASLDPRPALSGELAVRLATLALLVEEEELAERYLREALAADAPADVYFETAARLALRDGRSADALLAAQRWRSRAPESPAAALVLAEALVAQDRLAEAGALLDEGGVLKVAAPGERLRLGRVLLALEAWGPLGEVVVQAADVGDELWGEREFLRAVVLAQAGELPEALATLDYLLEERPEDYDLQLWRAVVLRAGRQAAAAREVLLRLCEAAPARPEAWYWRALVELDAGAADEAGSLFELALRAAPRHAPAWEGLGTLALNRGEVESAIENLTRAAELNPRRPTAHFLCAIAWARRGEREPCAASLRAALQLDPRLLNQALATDLLRRLFDADELQALAQPGPASMPVADGAPDPA